MPGTHRTPPDDDGSWAEVDDGRLRVYPSGRWRYRATYDLAPDALPALVAALAAHLTVDARRALTRDLAAQDGDAVVKAEDVSWLVAASWMQGVPDSPVMERARAAVEAARPVPLSEEAHRG